MKREQHSTLEPFQPHYRAIALESAAIAGKEPNDFFTYFEIESGAAFGAVFKDQGEQIRYFDPSDTLYALAFEAWEAEPEEQRWLVLEFYSRNGSFELRLTYPHEVDPEGHPSDRRQAALAQRYGDRPIIYPPLPEGI